MGKRKKKRRPLHTFLKYAFLSAASVLLFNIGYWLVYPDIPALKRENPKKTSFMLFRESEWKEKGKKIKASQKWVPLSGISRHLIEAVLIAEDDKFWSHEGFDFDAMEKALLKDVKHRRFKAGGSTITQQLAKNLYLSPSKSPLRKLKEAAIAWRMERTLSKERILELYLNAAEWGDGIFGIEAASRLYFGKPASALTAEEAVRLASVLPNPVKYRPDRPSKYVDKRSEIIYKTMVKRGLAE